jgi:protein TonB
VSREVIIAGIAAVLLHAFLLFGFRLESAAAPLPISDTAVDVSLEGAESSPAAAPAAATTPATSEPTPPPPVETPPPPVTPPPPEPPPETPPPAITAEAPQVAPPTPAPAARPVHHMPPHSAHASQTASRAVGPVGTASEGHGKATSASAGGSGASPIRARSNPKPPYPPEAERLHQQGRVILEVQVSSGGRATSVSVKRSSGFPMLDNAAVQAVQRWTFEPARVAGLPVAGRADVPVNFSLGQ